MIGEEPTEENIRELIMQLPEGLTPVERLVLSNYGTVQTLLSVIFRTPIKVDVLSQYEFANKTIVRWAKLSYNKGEDVVCLAKSVIYTDNEGLLTGIREQKMGIGQLIAAKELQTRRRILGFHADKVNITRSYIIEDIGMTDSGNHVNIVITEIFSRAMLNPVTYEPLPLKVPDELHYEASVE